MTGKRLALIILGWLSLITGIIGIFLPLLPTTPLVLLAAWCFSKSSERFHAWLLQHKYFGPIVSDWQSDQGIPKKARNRALIFMWAGMTLSMFIVARFWATIGLCVIGIAVSIHLLRMPLRKESNTESSPPSTE